MKILKTKNLLFGFAAALTTLGLAACNSGGGSSSPGSATGTYVQVERLGRPAINEALIFKNANLNLWNSVAPSVDLSTAGAGIVTEAGGTLTAINGYAAGQGLMPPPVSQVVSGFLPDVMRIDTTKALPGASASLTTIGGGMAYAGCLGATKAILCGGRKLRDNVVQITVNYLANGLNAGFAGVTYDPQTQGPPALLGAFPYLAAPL